MPHGEKVDEHQKPHDDQNKEKEVRRGAYFSG